MGRSRGVHVCSDCGHEEPRWAGRCPRCRAWGTVATIASSPVPDGSRDAGAGVAAVRAAPLTDLAVDAAPRLTSGIGELDRVVGGGLVPGSVVLVGGEPGVGKSTLLLQAVAALARGDATALYVTGEESLDQVRLRAARLGLRTGSVLVAETTALPAFLDLVERHVPAVAVVDSIQTLTDPAAGGVAGSVAAVRHAAATVVERSRASGTATILVGQVTKDGSVAGPKALEHLVDAVIALEGDSQHDLRLLRSTKNRFGAAGEVGCFVLGERGFDPLHDPSRRLLRDFVRDRPGVAVAVTVEGPRALAVEVQALTVRSTLTVPRRQTSGLDTSRLTQLAAVLERRAGVSLARDDVFASVVGGLRVREPAADLAIVLALASAVRDRAPRRGVVAIGEVGLAGEVRPVPRLARRLAEASRLGFDGAVVPATYDGPDHGLRLRRVATVAEALVAGLAPPDAR